MRYTIILIILLMPTLLLSACAVERSLPPTATSLPAIITVAPATPTSSPSLPATPQPLFTFTPTPSASLPPFPTFTPSPVVTPRPMPSRFPPAVTIAMGADVPNRLSEAEGQWQAAGITHYRITVNYITSLATSGPRTVEVRDGVIVTQPPSCTSAAVRTNTCLGIGERATDYTVSGLFDILRREISQPSRGVRQAAFDPTYGYPTLISSEIKTPNVTVSGGDVSWLVAEFVVLL